ncbi:30S ribosomal protein S2 [Candidatus Gromoviella agglomerans]|uniref:30S ribosomal protein S2 n=1 Tax=Candidatus Gromoviella agglomerans TaxID=2806609 RepID=UPI001E2F9AC3|nr:30S ribosomal protein S2 [Candidatus Gromoviella agglomerans]UFX98446.1 30S ribosomal protein S2 [Candidatus Gromoviella agglomerans]
MISPNFSVQDMVDARLHWGHKSNKHNPLMDEYIFKNSGGISIIDLRKTYKLMQDALSFLYKMAKSGERILFVGTKENACHIIKETAESTGQYHVTSKWLGGMLTNWSTIKKSIKRMDDLEQFLQKDSYTKKEKSIFSKDLEKSIKNLSGVRKMSDLPKVLVVLDAKREVVAITEAKKMNIPIICIVDTNVDPRGIEYPIPGNDDSEIAISFYFHHFKDAILQGLNDGLSSVKNKTLKEASVEEELVNTFSQDSDEGKGVKNEH